MTMTKEDIEAMEAGPKIEVLVATLVLGLQPCDKWQTAGYSLAAGEELIHYGKCDPPCFPAKAPSWYSRLMGPAWDVVERVRQQWHFLSNDSPRNLIGDHGTYEIHVQSEVDIILKAPLWRNYAVFERNGGLDCVAAKADTMPLAICRAALLTTL